MNTQKGAKIGFISRIDYGSKGFRKALIEDAFECFSKIEGTHFNILTGGLVSAKALALEMKIYVKTELDRLKDENRDLPKDEKLSRDDLAREKSRLEWEFLDTCAAELAKIIPVLKGPDPEDPKKEKVLDLFIVTSPAFDGELGEIVAQKLSDIRLDIRVMNQGGDRFPVKYLNKEKLIWVLTPAKAVWMRGDYYSTAVERVIKDKIKQTSQSSPDLYVVGGFGSGIHKPKGELKYQYVSVPVCHRLEETRVSENQVGVGVLEYPGDGSNYRYRVYSFKDLVANELSFIVPPEKASHIQKKIVEAIKKRGWATRGILRSDLQVSLDVLENELKRLMSKKTFGRMGENWPGIFEQESSKKIYFNLEYVQHRLKYSQPHGPYQEDRIVSFACMHAGSRETDYNFFVNEVPKIILRQNASVLIDSGDTIEGLKHFLDRKGEILPGMNNYTIQEKFAAVLVGSVIFKVFRERFLKELKQLNQKQIHRDKLTALVNKALLQFYYIYGNHDLWETEDGFGCLVKFHDDLVMYLTACISKLLASNRLPIISVFPIVDSKVQCRQFVDLPSGLKLSIQHPHMSRAKTTSIRPQEMLEFGKRAGCQVTIGANFHVSETVSEWDMDLGQCVCQQIGTIKHGSSFERNKMKMVDQGVGYLRILSQGGRILMTESCFTGESQVKAPIDNIPLINDIIHGLGIDPLK
jgi:hypothetical protein